MRARTREAGFGFKRAAVHSGTDFSTVAHIERPGALKACAWPLCPPKARVAHTQSRGVCLAAWKAVGSAQAAGHPPIALRIKAFPCGTPSPAREGAHMASTMTREPVDETGHVYPAPGGQDGLRSAKNLITTRVVKSMLIWTSPEIAFFRNLGDLRYSK